MCAVARKCPGAERTLRCHPTMSERQQVCLDTRPGVPEVPLLRAYPQVSQFPKPPSRTWRGFRLPSRKTFGKSRSGDPDRDFLRLGGHRPLRGRRSPCDGSAALPRRRCALATTIRWSSGSQEHPACAMGNRYPRIGKPVTQISTSSEGLDELVEAGQPDVVVGSRAGRTTRRPRTGRGRRVDRRERGPGRRESPRTAPSSMTKGEAPR